MDSVERVKSLFSVAFTYFQRFCGLVDLKQSPTSVPENVPLVDQSPARVPKDAPLVHVPSADPNNNKGTLAQSPSPVSSAKKRISPTHSFQREMKGVTPKRFSPSGHLILVPD